MNSGNWELRPIEVITAENARARVCLFAENDGTFSFELQRHEVVTQAPTRYLEQWSAVGAVAMKACLGLEPADAVRIYEWPVALGRALKFLAALTEYVGYGQETECACCIENECACVNSEESE